MSSKELARYRVLGGVLEGQLALQEAAVALGVSPRHARRLLRRLRQQGPEGLVHGNRGRSPANRTPDELRGQILEWVEDRYAGFNDTHLREILAEREDRHSALRRPTQVGQALEDLGIHPLFALSPQAKGRVERLFGVLQDRLLAEMRLDGITTLEAANDYLERRGIRRYNRRFRIAPRSPEPAYRPRRGVELHKILAFRYEAVVLNDNTVRLGGLTIDIPPGPRGRAYAKARVDVRQHLDGSWTVYYQDQTIAQAPASPLTEPLRFLKPGGPNSRRTKAARQELFVYLPNTQPPGTLSLGS